MKLSMRQYDIAIDFLELLNTERYKERARVKVEYEEESAKEEYARIDKELEAINILRCVLNDVDII